MIDMYGSEVGVGDAVVTFVKEGKGCILKHVVEQGKHKHY